MTEVLTNNRILGESDKTVIIEDLEEEEILIGSQIMDEDAILIATDTRECEPLLSNGGGIHEIVYNQFIGRKRRKLILWAQPV